MVVVRVLDGGEVALLAAAFPEKGRVPVDRHTERFRLQESGDLTYLVAWEDHFPVGHVFLRWPDRQGGLTEQARRLGCAEVGDLFVAAGARGRGVGRRLMTELEGLARARGCTLLGLEVTVSNPWNDVARGLYERLGYRDAGLGVFISGYTYWDANGVPHRDEEPYRYLVKHLDR